MTAERAVGTLHYPCSLHPTGTPPGFSVLKLSPSFSAPRRGDFGLRGENTDVLQSRNTKPAASYRHVQLTAARQPGDAGKQTPPEHRHLFFFFFCIDSKNASEMSGVYAASLQASILLSERARKAPRQGKAAPKGPNSSPAGLALTTRPAPLLRKKGKKK